MTSTRKRVKPSSRKVGVADQRTIEGKGKKVAVKALGKQLPHVESSSPRKLDPHKWGGYFEPSEDTLQKIREIEDAYAKSSKSTKPFARRG